MKLITILPVLALASAMAGCVVEPVHPGYRAPAGVVYVAPTYASPGPGYEWQYHERFGWGWHHPQYGWHQGWH